jgi:hypothetical protein
MEGSEDLKSLSLVPSPVEKGRYSIAKPDILFYQFYLRLNGEHGYSDDLLVLMLKNKLQHGLPLLWRGIEGEAVTCYNG